MADKLMRTAVVMTFFLILALFSGCGTDETSLTVEGKEPQVTLQSGDTLTLPADANPFPGDNL